ncbi:Ku protein [Tianweitania populi]|uniref:Non-homologous end joining protein Ku n=1 Tax=Tianweitania populi TaxID=1607949 RepID=A0A8J3DR05_9HYPH|nr:Ku protein [Tianweitania populi]GHD16777.1 non-homologous end joining protein Ku [Tianweitania populi]
MAPRANWKGFLKVGALSCPVALYTAVSTSERIAFHTLNRKTGNRVHREFIDAETGKPVEKDDQIKGYEVNQGDYITLEPDEVASAVPDSDKTLAVEAFVTCSDIDDVYLDRPYYLAPADKGAQEAFALIREGLAKSKSAAFANTVLFRRVRNLLIRPHNDGLIATTLNFDYEVRSAKEAFADMSDTKIAGEMLDLAKHIINTKSGKFDPKSFDDRYESALAELVKAKMEGRDFKAAKPKAPAKVVDLMDALRRSAEGAGAKAAPKKTAAKKAPARKPAAAKRAKAEPQRKAS